MRQYKNIEINNVCSVLAGLYKIDLIHSHIFSHMCRPTFTTIRKNRAWKGKLFVKWKTLREIGNYV
jgi:hypothetical protein